MVYGHPAVAVAIDQRVTVSLRPANEWLVDGGHLESGRHPHLRAIVERLWPPRRRPCTIHVDSELPSAAGLGSSAALSVAIAAAIRSMIGRQRNRDGQWAEGFKTGPEVSAIFAPEGEDVLGPSGIEVEHMVGREALDPDELSLLGHMAEARAQSGLASPMDTATSAYGGSVVLSDELVAGCDWQGTRRLPHPRGERRWELHTLELPRVAREAWLVLGHTGEHASTAEMVGLVEQRVAKSAEVRTAIEAIGRLTRRGIEVLRKGDLHQVGRLMDMAHELLKWVGVSSESLDRLVEAAHPHSLGAKLTGAGGGGCMVALTTTPKRAAESIELAGGRAYISRLGAPGVQVAGT